MHYLDVLRRQLGIDGEPFEAKPVIPKDAVLGCCPDKSFPILRQRRYGKVAQPL